MSRFDLIVVGAGPGGYVAAIRARQLGLRSAVVEREHLGGICLNWGCIPTKALLRTAEIHHLLHDLDAFGLSADNVRFDVEKVVRRSRQVSGRLAAGVEHLLKKNEVEVIDGSARLDGPGTLKVERRDGSVARLEASHIILATGARPRTLPGIGPDGDRIWTYKEAMVPDSLPRSLLVIGSGAIGMEFASFFDDMGSDVTVVEILPQILPVEDAEIAVAARAAFERRGMRIFTDTSVAEVERRGDGVVARLQQQGGALETLAFDRVVLAVGIEGNVENLGLEGTGVRVDRGHIEIDPWCATGEPGIYAIGDVAGPPWLAHKASHEGILCVERIAGVETHPLQTDRIPGCTYCRPQIASVGLTEAAAREAGFEVRVGRFPLLANGKAVAMGDTQGLVKTVFDAATGELLGAHMLGSEVTELIQGFAIARTLEATEAELVQSVFPHPTLSETMHESVLAAFGRPIHI